MMKLFKEMINVSVKQVIGVTIGNILVGIGIGIFKYAQLGNDPYSAMCLAVYEKLGLSYAGFLIVLNSLILVIQILFGKKYIGLGTLINGFGLGYVVQGSIWFSEVYMPVLSNFGIQLLVVVVGVIVAGFGLSLYQTSDAGIAPYDSIPLMMRDHLKFPYFASRISIDGLFTLTAFLAGGLIGIGTLVCAFGFGPVVDFFNRTVSGKLLDKSGL